MLPEGTLVEFSQKIHGIPLLRTDGLTTDADGTIVELTTQLVDPAMGEQSTLDLGEGRTRRGARADCDRDRSSQVTSYELMNSTTLFYSVEPGRKLVPYYTFNVVPQPSGSSAAVRVNAHSREARLLVNPN